jgi:hypothetical protein
MPVFNKWLIINDKTLNFEFSKVVTPSGNKYFVNLFDQQNLVASFEVKEKEQAYWEIVLPVPDWILQVQENIIHALEEHLEAGL